LQYSVIIPCFNAAHTIGNQLDALYHQCLSDDWEIIVSDNGCTDETLSIVESFSDKLPKLRVINASFRRGPSYARNEGAKAAKGDALIFIDADDVIDNWFMQVMAVALLKYDFVAPRMEYEKLSSPRALALKGTHRQRDGLIEYNYVPFLPYAGTSGLGIKRWVHESVGGFDESLIACEDCDYGWRVQLGGVSLHFEKNAIIHVRHKDLASGAFRQARVWGQSHALLIKKFRSMGMPKLPVSEGLKLWLRLLWHLPVFCTQAYRDQWLWNFCYRFGQLLGCIRYRILAL